VHHASQFLQYDAPDKVFTLVSQLLTKHPDIKVFMGGDGFVLPAYHAFQQLGKLTDDMYFSSIDGDPAVIDLVAQGGPYRACSAFAWTLMGYGMGRITADWIDGKPVPRVMFAKNTLLDTPAEAKSFTAAAADPRSTYEDRATYSAYVPLLGNTSYGARSAYWTSDYEPPV
jgi:ABC-type sugar transport system substrate-binding protein